jgi:hemerythrin-like metal-binding protein
MELIQWREEFCTGISGVDFEHQKLIEEINSVYQLIDDQADSQAVVDRLGDIYGSISAHFALEEQMMRKHGYDQYQQHAADHNRLLDDIVDITDDYESSGKVDDQVFKQKLNDWFQNHFKTHDARLHKLSEFMQHPTVNRSTMASMLKKARQRFLNQTNNGA